MSLIVHLRGLLNSVPAACARPALAALLAWLGLIKVVPSLNPHAAAAEEFVQLIAGGKAGGGVLLLGVGLLQIACAILLLIPRLRMQAAVLLVVHLVVLLVVAVLNIPALLGDTVINGTGLTLAKTTVLLICGLVLLAPGPASKSSAG